MEGRRRRSFTQDYKPQAANLVVSSGRSVTSVAKEVGLSASVLRRWVDKLSAGHEPTAAPRRPITQAALPSADQAAEIASLQRENDRLRMESSSPVSRHPTKKSTDYASTCQNSLRRCRRPGGRAIDRGHVGRDDFSACQSQTGMVRPN